MERGYWGIDRLTELDSLERRLLEECLNEEYVIAGSQLSEVSNDACTEVAQTNMYPESE